MPDEILIRFSVKDDGSPVIERVNEKLKGTKKESQALVPGLEKARKSLTSFASENAALIGILVGVGAAIKSAVDETLRYDNTVRQLAEISGTGAEESSRLLQVLDDFKISAEDVNAATRAMTREGLSPTLETLSRLSDEYNRLNPGQEQAEFLMKNFGRSGLKFAEAMGKGGDELKKMGQEVEKSLIRTDAQIAKTRLAELELDRWADKVQALKVELGSGLIGAIDGSNWAIQKQAEKLYTAATGADYLRDQMFGLTDAQKAAWEEAQKLANEQYLLSQGIDITTGSIEGQTVSLEDQDKAMKFLSDTLQSQIGLINDIQSAEDSYTEKSKDLADQRAEKEAELAKLRKQGYWEQGNDIQNALSDLEDIKRAEADLAKEREKQTLQFVSNILAEQLARDGWTQTEFDAFAKQQEAWGLWSSDVVAKAQAAWQEADKVATSIASIPSEKTSTITVATNYVNTYTNLKQTNPGYYSSEKHAAGGVFMIPPSYGNEGFRMGGGDTASGGEKLAIAPKDKSFLSNDDIKKLARAVRDGLVQAGVGG